MTKTATAITPAVEKALTAADILKNDDTLREKVFVPEWGGFVYVSTMSGTAKDMYESLCLEYVGGKMKQKEGNIRAKLIAASVTDEAGNLMFKASQVEALGKKSARALDRVFEVASRLNAVTNDDVKELAKN